MKPYAKIGTLTLQLLMITWIARCALVGTTACAQPASQQAFVCNTGYTLKECHEQVSVLRPVLARFHAERLEHWTWILVKSRDWRDLVRPRGLDLNSPAFTYLEKRETFFEEALFTPVPVRSGELLLHWALPADKLLALAVTHELGHALCQDGNELRANEFARLLLEGGASHCATVDARNKSHGPSQNDRSRESSNPARHAPHRSEPTDFATLAKQEAVLEK